MCNGVDRRPPREGGRGLHILLHVSDVFVVVREFVGIGLGGRAGGRAPGTPWLRFGIWAGGVSGGAPSKCMPLNRRDRDVDERSVAPFGR